MYFLSSHFAKFSRHSLHVWAFSVSWASQHYTVCSHGSPVVKHRLRETHNMEAFVGKFERTSADKYEEMLKVIQGTSAAELKPLPTFRSWRSTSFWEKLPLCLPPVRMKDEGRIGDNIWYFQFVRFSRMAACGTSRPPQHWKQWSSSSRWLPSPHNCPPPEQTEKCSTCISACHHHSLQALTSHLDVT